MNANEQTPRPKKPIGPITDAYLHREVHPHDGIAPPKPKHAGQDEGRPVYPKAGAPAPKTNAKNEEELWMYC